MDDRIETGFHPAVARWFGAAFGTPTDVQRDGWAAIREGGHVLIAAPTGSGKTLAAFLAAIDALVRQAQDADLGAATRIVYVSPLKALGKDVAQNLDGPLAGIREAGGAAITTALRTGDTSQADRARMLRRPPHILVTTPEGLYALVTSDGGRGILGTVETVIVDEIHALAPDRRGAHLALTLERLDALVQRPVQRIGLSATQKPLARVGDFLTGGRPCRIVDATRPQPRDLRIEVPDAPLGALLPGEVMEDVYDSIAAEIAAHRTTIVFVNARRQCERVAHALSERLGKEAVAAHHGSLSLPLRTHAEARLKAGDLQALVATASLELGIDIGAVDLVIQLGSVKRIATFLQRVGRANHHRGGVPKGRLWPLSRDELIEAVALFEAVDAGSLDQTEIPDHPLDVLAQQMVAAAVSETWDVERLFALVRRAWPYRALPRADFDAVLTMLAEGFPTERGRRGILISWDRVGGTVTARKGAKMLALTNGGTIPDSGDYTVRLEPQGVTVGAIAEDFAIHQLPGHVIQLGSGSWRIRQVSAGEVRVEAAPGEAPYMPVWFGEQPARSAALSTAVSALRMEGVGPRPWLPEEGARALGSYLAAGAEALGAMPSAHCLVLERFSDLAGDTQIVVHAPLGARINRALALALRRILGTRLGVELQAAAIDDAILVSLPGQPELRLDGLLDAIGAEDLSVALTAAVLEVPMFMIRWRWAAARALAVPRMRGGRRVPPHIQRTDAEELLMRALPGRGGQALIRRDGRQGGLKRPGPAPATGTPRDHPLVQQTLADCLHETMDLAGLETLFDGIAAGEIRVATAERLTPSPFAMAVLAAKPPAFLDDAPLMDRRARNARKGPGHLEVDAGLVVDPDAVRRVRAELVPELPTEEDVATHLSLAGVLTAEEGAPHGAALVALEAAGRALRVGGHWIAAERAELAAAALPAARRLGTGADLSPDAALAELLTGRLETSGPVTPSDIARDLHLEEGVAAAALRRLEGTGALISGHHDPDRADARTWTDRRVLARIERLTRNRLRAEIEPVSLETYTRFLLRWQGLTGERAEGVEALAKVLERLDGLELPAAVWEAEVLPSRVARYDLDDLDALCLSGRVGWGRLSRPEGTRPALSRAMPMALFGAESLEAWTRLRAPQPVPGLSPPAEKLLAAVEGQGASFIAAIERSVRLLRAETEAGLMELVAAGHLTADSFAGFRALLAKPGRRASRLEMIGRSNSGRWSLLPGPGASDPVTRASDVEAYARALLKRWGVVVRAVVAREGGPVPWVEVLRVLRRLEARGEARGGYFVSGAGGEHFAHPDAVAMLRAVRDERGQTALGNAVAISAADPLNLSGVLMPGPRIPARQDTRILLRDGVPVAVSERGKTVALGETAPSPEERRLLTRSPAPAGLAVYG
ncbi:MAG: DEAD/DEAH box helicase [Pseudomonadota bacterium]